MQLLYKLARPTLLLSGVMGFAYVSMKAVTPTPQDLIKANGPVSVGERNARHTHTAQMMRYLEANARSDNPIWKFDPPPKMPSFAPKGGMSSNAQQELSERNVELKRRSDEMKRRRTGSSSNWKIRDIETEFK